MDATVPKGNMGYDQCTVPDTQEANKLLWSLEPFSKNSLRNLKERKTNHKISGIVASTFSDLSLEKELFERHDHTSPQPANFFVSQSWIADAPSVDFVACFTFTAWWITQRIYIAVKFMKKVLKAITSEIAFELVYTWSSYNINTDIYTCHLLHMHTLRIESGRTGTGK